jgi:hypothetical protein
LIISASRRTDIPAFYAQWFMNRIRDGFCLVPNPYNPKQCSRVPLKPEDVDVIVFWTRNPLPLFTFLDELDARGYRYYFQYTLLNYPRFLDPKTPSLNVGIRTFKTLADNIGPDKIFWRYDPFVFTTATDPGFHEAQFRNIAETLNGYTKRTMISFIDLYRKVQRRFRRLSKDGFELMDYEKSLIDHLMKTLVSISKDNGMTIYSCAEEMELIQLHFPAGKCIDNTYISETFGLTLNPTKDPHQRKACGCVVSKDIGMYDTCLYDCLYCYATNHERARRNNAKHDPDSPSLI